MNEMASYGITHYNSYYSNLNNINPASYSAANTMPSSSASTPTHEAQNSGPTKGLDTLEGQLQRNSFGSDSQLESAEEKLTMELLERGELEGVLKRVAGGMNVNACVLGSYPLHVAVKNVSHLHNLIPPSITKAISEPKHAGGVPPAQRRQSQQFRR